MLEVWYVHVRVPGEGTSNFQYSSEAEAILNAEGFAKMDDTEVWVTKQTTKDTKHGPKVGVKLERIL